MRVLIVEDEPYMAEAIRDGLRLEAIAADIAGDGDTALKLLSFDAYDIAVLDRDIPGPSGDEIAKRIVASGSGMPILILTAADRLDDKTTGFGLGAEDYLTKPFELQDATPTIGSHALLLQLTTNLVHNAIVHNLPEQGTVWVTTSTHRTSVVLTVENTGQKLTPQLVSTRVEPFQRGSKRT